MRNVLKSFDVFGSEYKFILQDSFSIKSIAGGIMTLLSFSFMIFTMIIFGNDFYYRLNPKVLIQESIHTEETLYKLNNYTVENRTVVFKVTKDVDQLNDWMVDANLPYTFQKTKNRSLMNKCNEDYVLNNFYKDNKELGKDELKTEFSYYCHNLDSSKFGLQDEDMGAGSILTSPLSIWAMDCNRTSDGLKSKTCPSWWNKTQTLDSPYVEVWMESILFNIDDLEHPFTPTFRSPGRFFLSQKSQQIIILNLQFHNLTDNLGIFTDSSKISTEVGLGSTSLIVNVPDAFSRPKYRFEAHIGWEKTYKNTQGLI